MLAYVINLINRNNSILLPEKVVLDSTHSRVVPFPWLCHSALAVRPQLRCLASAAPPIPIPSVPQHGWACFLQGFVL